MKESEQQKIFKSWLDQHRGLLFKVLRAYAFTQEDREDLFQEISAQVWRSIPNFRQESAVTTWLYRIALNIAISWSTKEHKKVEPQSIDGMEHLISEKDTPTDERLTWLYAEIKKMNEVDKSLTLLLLDGFSYKEMSDMLGIKESNVGVKIHRIKKELIKKSEKYEYDGV
ncbi:MAG: RNA polymerase sigma factor [Cyclobacteriaceae bacterium]